MATSDIDLSIRIAVIQVLGDIESHFPFEEEEKEKLCLLLFDEEPRVRRAVSSFVRAVWEEEVEEQLSAQRKPSNKDKERIGIKVLSRLFVKWGKALDNLSGDTAESEIGDEDIQKVSKVARSNPSREKN
jgi:cohesin complex subunit SA-1/2